MPKLLVLCSVLPGRVVPGKWLGGMFELLDGMYLPDVALIEALGLLFWGTGKDPWWDEGICMELLKFC